MITARKATITREYTKSKNKATKIIKIYVYVTCSRKMSIKSSLPIQRYSIHVDLQLHAYFV